MTRVPVLALIAFSLLTLEFIPGDENSPRQSTIKVAEPTIPEVLEEYDAKVVGITDGDTIRVLTESKEEVKIRLEGIDAPEKGQEFSRQSTNALKSAVGGHTVRIRVTGKDKYGRTLAYVLAGEVDVNQRMIEQGWAWHFKKYNSEGRLADAETEARDAKKGLWKEANPTAPWDYRNPPKVEAPQSENEKDAAVEKFWLNTGSGVRHNSGCKHFGKTKKGKYCGPTEGKACGICGG